MNQTLTRPMKWIGRGALATICAAALSLVLASSPAQADQPSQAKHDFQTRYATAIANVAKARARVVASEKALRKARQRDRLKGEARVEIYAEIESAKRELEAAEEVLSAIPEDARRAGVPPGWLREVEERQADES